MDYTYDQVQKDLFYALGYIQKQKLKLLKWKCILRVCNKVRPAHIDSAHTDCTKVVNQVQ